MILAFVLAFVLTRIERGQREANAPARAYNRVCAYWCGSCNQQDLCNLAGFGSKRGQMEREVMERPVLPLKAPESSAELIRSAPSQPVPQVQRTDVPQRYDTKRHDAARRGTAQHDTRRRHTTPHGTTQCNNKRSPRQYDQGKSCQSSISPPFQHATIDPTGQAADVVLHY
jgi:hypothetical protein